ncbi:MAG TPA: FAD-binding oxidoreductase [Candidatus Obscuribacterales bacterium]
MTTNLTFDWHVLEVESPSALAAFLGSGTVIMPGAPRQLPAGTLRRIAGKRVTFLDFSPLRSVIEHEKSDQVISVQTGISIASLDAVLKSSNQWLPLSLFPGERSLFEFIATGNGGLPDHHFGGPRDLVLGMTVVLMNGETIRTGGKVVKNVTGYDLNKLFVGSRATMGIPVAATLRLFARPETAHTMFVAASTPVEALEQAVKIMHLELPVTGLEIIHSSCLNYRALSHGGDKADLCHWLSELYRSRHLAVVVQMAGHSRVVKEQMPRLSSLLLDGSCRHFKLEHELDDADIGALFSFPDLHDLGVNLSLSAGQMTKLLKALDGPTGTPPFCARPGTGRLSILTGFASGKQDLIASLSAVCKNLGMAVQICFADDDFEFKCEQLNGDDAVRDEIKQRLKERFDPGRLLNPAVAC